MTPTTGRLGLLLAALILAASAGTSNADLNVPAAQVRFYKGLASSWTRRSASGISNHFASQVTLDLGPHCKAGNYRRSQAINVLGTHLGRHVEPDPRQTKIVRMSTSGMLLRHHYRDRVTGRRAQQNLYFSVRPGGTGWQVTSIRR